MSQGGPWDIGNMHYVRFLLSYLQYVWIPGTVYNVDAKDKLTTSLTLSPPPSGGAEGAGGGFGLGSINFSTGGARQSQSGISMIAGQFPDPWTPPDLSVMPFMSAQETLDQMAKADADTEQPKSPPLTLPQWFGETGLVILLTIMDIRRDRTRWDRTSCVGCKDTSGRRLGH